MQCRDRVIKCCDNTSVINIPLCYDIHLCVTTFFLYIFSYYVTTEFLALFFVFVMTKFYLLRQTSTSCLGVLSRQRCNYVATYVHFLP